MIIYNVLLIPVQMGFDWPDPPADDPIAITDVIVDVTFTIDILHLNVHFLLPSVT